MVTGRYFRLNLDSSVMKKGITVFEYYDLPAYFGVFNELSPRYPVSVVITETEVKFLLHYFTFYSEVTNSYVFDIHKGKACQTNHTEEEIMSFKFERNASDGLASQLKEVFESIFPESQESYLYQCIERRYSLKSLNKLLPCSRAIYKTLIDNDANPQNLSYSSCAIWGLIDTGENNRHFSLYDQRNQYKKNISLFLRKLLLDFMFDMMHTDVFENSVFFDKMKTSLMSDFFFSAIIKKAEYYYYRELVNRKVASDKLQPASGISLFMKFFEKAEEQWMEVIMSPMVSKHFKSIHTDRVFENIKAEQRRKYSFESVPSWFADPEDEMRRVLFPLKKRDKIGYFTSQLLYDSIDHPKVEPLKEDMKKTSERLEARTLKASKWFLQRYDFADSLRIHFFPFFNHFLIAGILLMFFFIFSLNKPVPDFLNVPMHIFIPSLITLGLFIWGVVLGIKALVFKNGKELNFIKMSHLRLSFKYFKNVLLMFVILLLAGLFLIVNPKVDIVFRLIALTGALVLLFWKFMRKSLHLVMPRLFAAITTAWFTIALSEDLFKSFFDKPVSVLTVALLFVVVAGFLFSEMGKVIPDSSFVKKAARVGELMIFGYAMSLLVGFMMINFTGDYFIERSGYLEQYYDENMTLFQNLENPTHPEMLNHLAACDEFTTMSRLPFAYPSKVFASIGHYSFFILRNFMIQFALVAMFVGVFLQMSFENKRLTDN